MVLLFLSALLLGLSTVEASLTYRGVDWSSVAVEEAAGHSYKAAGGMTEPLETILAASGVNTVRQRVWVDPAGGTYDIAYNVALARRAKAAGLRVYLDLHLSNTWADPGHQATPRGWPSSGVGELASTLYNYTKTVADAFETAGVQPEIISIGNEITSGLLWPTGRTTSYANIAKLLHSASWGIKNSTLSRQPKIMIHIDNGWKWSTQEYFYTTVLKQGTLLASDFDMMGVSYYPFYNSGATLASLRTSLANMASKWGKEIVVAETDWPTSCSAPAYAFPSDTKSIPFTAAGQATWIQNVASVVAGVSNGTGLFYWEPAWIDNAGLGSSCANNLMFSSSGTALPSLSVFSSI